MIKFDDKSLRVKIDIGDNLAILCVLAMVLAVVVGSCDSLQWVRL